MANEGERGRNAGDALLHPVSLASLALLLLNDHLLKTVWPGLLTGKLSDACGMAFFPILVLAAWELGLALVGRWRGPAIRPLLVAVVVTGVVFAIVKTQPIAADGFGWGLGAAQWLLALPVRLVGGGPPPAVAQARVLVDPTDLFALPALAIAAWVGRSRLGADPARPRVTPVLATGGDNGA